MEKPPTRHTLHPGTTVQELVPHRGTEQVRLDADSEVLCIHRGTEVIEDKWDSIPFVIQPGYFKTKFGAAKHFRDRAVVPGSRNPETHSQTSFIAIIGTVDMRPDGSFVVTHPIDDPSEWTKFTAQEIAEYEGAVDALDRANMTHPIQPDVQLADTSSVIAGRSEASSRVKGGNKTGGRGGSRRPQVIATDPDVMQPIPPEDNEVVREARRASGQSAAERGEE